jgi:hypothetical protein
VVGVAIIVVLWGGFGVSARAETVEIRSDPILHIDGRPVFPIGLTKPPPPDALAPSG